MSVFNATRIVGKTVLITGASSGIGAVSLPSISLARLASHRNYYQGHRHLVCKSRYQRFLISLLADLNTFREAPMLSSLQGEQTLWRRSMTLASPPIKNQDCSKEEDLLLFN